MTANISRRAALRRFSFIAAGVAVGSQALSFPAHAAGKAPDPDKLRQEIRRVQVRNKRVLTGIPSKNGWEMEKIVDDHGHIYTRPVPGTPLSGIQVRMGDVETVLVHAICRFHYEIDELRRGDVIGWRAPNAVRKGLSESNQASGTAVQIRPGHYPAGTRGGFFPDQQLVIRDILAQLGGVLRWGGDDRRPDESLFYISMPPGDERLAEMADKVRLWNNAPGEGAGAPVDVRDPRRRSAAKALERRHKSES